MQVEKSHGVDKATPDDSGGGGDKAHLTLRR